MIESSSLWVVTDVDGTLMDHYYDLTPAKKVINWLKELKIPVILCTSKTAAEVLVIRKDLNLKDPFIVENGAAIYGQSKNKNMWEIILGKKYNSLEKILSNLSEDVNYDLIPLNSLSDEEATDLTGLKGNSLSLMRDRHWSMPFLNPPEKIETLLNKYCHNYDVKIFRGNRMSHLLSNNSDKGLAIQKLKTFSKNSNVNIIGLGDSPNDLPLLMNSDYKIVIPNNDGPNQKLIHQLGKEKFILAKEPHGNGWKEEVTKLVKSFLD